MSATENKAVFLSYASQDAEAARRICEALRAAGVEVWFDQSELRGGDAWDAKIRKQIKECALFVPIISANTQARREGYFRIEWKLAAQRTHAIAEGTPFLLPIVLDATPDAEALVPEEFRAVQWTRLKGDQASAEFSARTKSLLEGNADGLSAGRKGSADEMLPHPARRGRRIIRWAMLVGLVAVGIGGWHWWPARHAPAPMADNSVAVLPFTNLSAEKANDYFSDGISEEICNLLGRVPGLRVPATASSFTFKGRHVSPAEIARALNVTYLLDGSVQKDGERVRIRARLLNPRDGLPLWTSEPYDREIKDVFKLQDEIAGLIARHLRMQLRYAFTTGSGPVHPEAYQLYSQGRQQLSLGTNLRSAQEFFKKAIELDPKFGRAYAGLAESRLAVRNWKWRDRASLEVTEIVGLADTAVRLDPDSAETHSARGLAYYMQWEFEAAQRELRLGLKLNANWSVAHQYLKGAMSSDGRMDESLQAIRRAAELDPLTPRILFLDSYTLWEAGRYSASLAEAERALALQPNDRARMIKLKALTSLGRLDEAVPLAREQAGTSRGGEDAAICFNLAGMQDQADAILARGTEKKNVTLLAAMGRPEDFLATLDVDDYPLGGLGILFYAPYLDSIRKDPRFVKFLAGLHLEEAHERAQKWRQLHPPERPWAK